MLPGFMILWLVVGAVLLAAAALKAADRSGSVVALSGYGVPGRLAGPAWVALVVAEAGAGRRDRRRAGRAPRTRRARCSPCS